MTHEERQQALQDAEKYYWHGCERSGIPDYMRGGLIRYLVYGVPTGNFLTAVFSNDFMEAFRRADDTNQPILHHYAKFLFNYAPQGSYGSLELVAKWLDFKREERDSNYVRPIGADPTEADRYNEYKESRT